MRPDDIAREVTLTARKVAVQQMISPHLVESIGVEATQNLFGEELVLMLRAFVYGVDGSASTVTTHYEFTSWWQMFKQSAIDAGNPFFRPEKVRRRPVRVRVTADQFSWWPDMDAPVPPKWGAPIRVFVTTRAEPMGDDE